MDVSPTPPSLNELLKSAGLPPLAPETSAKFDAYLSLFVRWNERLNLSSVREPEEIIKRHFIESIAVALALPPAIPTLLDFGSGGGLPGIPIALSRPHIAVTLAESHAKKAAFLQEAARVLGINANVHPGRAETLQSVFDCVVLRAVDKMPEAVRAATKLIVPAGYLALMTTDAGLAELQSAAGTHFRWDPPVRLPNSDSRILALGISSRA
ncbi:MAG TPA: 16S rRNA (guanine(527)-N(7))-methyltransferase RsmG [Terracidiphilus sp.]|nr:16S rRNA (guanine(527)-N(7))-methyltransferase RsmG [Terracidiphilus sp.]